jgi:hypothetical protein
MKLTLIFFFTYLLMLPANGTTRKWDYPQMGLPANGTTRKWDYPQMRRHQSRNYMNERRKEREKERWNGRNKESTLNLNGATNGYNSWAILVRWPTLISKLLAKAAVHHTSSHKINCRLYWKINICLTSYDNHMNTESVLVDNKTLPSLMNRPIYCISFYK